METKYEVTPVEGGRVIKSWTRGVAFEDQAREQLIRLAKLPFIHDHVAVMPDVHAGKGSTVGTVLATRGAVIPAAVGVDIGCGMNAYRTNLIASDLPDNLAAIRSDIEAAVPHGGPGDIGSWPDDHVRIPNDVLDTWLNKGGFGTEVLPEKARSNFGVRQLGTLGTGNHFIELCLDEDQAVWVMLHSGSRGFGNRIGSYYIEKAKEDMRRWFINLPDQDLAYLPEGSTLFDEYVQAVQAAQDYALANRSLMMDAVIDVLEKHFPVPVYSPDNLNISCHHNFLAHENHFGANVWVTRKGAVRARKGDWVIIPGSMGARSYICRGFGNKDSFESCSHGAGRVMSRAEAKRRFTIEDHKKAMGNIEARVDVDIIDETPMAYKPIEAVMAAQQDLVEVVAELRQVLCVKG